MDGTPQQQKLVTVGPLTYEQKMLSLIRQLIVTIQWTVQTSSTIAF